MKRANVVRVGLILTLALAVSTAAFADQSYFSTGNKSSLGLKHPMSRNPYFDPRPIQLPRPIGDNWGIQAAVSGPIASSPQTVDATSAFTAVRGGGSSMYTEKQSADQEIGRLIRRLD